MLDRIISLLTGNRSRQRKAADGGEAFQRLNALAPLGVPERKAAETPVASVVCREAVLGRDQRVAGYAFMLRRAINARMRAASANVQRLYDQVLLANLGSMQMHRLLGHRLAFVPVSPATVDSEAIDALPRQVTVLVIEGSDALTVNASATLAKLDTLRREGFRLALSDADFAAEIWQPFLALAEFAVLAIAGRDLPDVLSRSEAITRRHPHVKMIATGVETLEDFHACARLSFAYFSGPFITSREAWDAPRLDVSRLKIMQLLNQLRADSEVKDIAASFKQDPGLSVRILRYINSPGMGLAIKIGSIEQAILLLGQKQLYRWLTLLLFAGEDAQPMDAVLLENALVRARLAELIARDAMTANEQNEVFITGMFSLIDLLLRMPIHQALAQISLPDAVVDALLHQRGKYAVFVELAKACETFDQEAIGRLANQAGIDPEALNAAHMDALVWAQQVTQ